MYLFSFSLHKNLIDGLESCGLLVDYCYVLIRCLDSHSDGTHSLQRIHSRASDVILNVSKSVPMKNKLIYILNGLRVSKLSEKFYFWLNYDYSFIAFKKLTLKTTLINQWHKIFWNHQRNTDLSQNQLITKSSIKPVFGRIRRHSNRMRLLLKTWDVRH